MTIERGCILYNPVTDEIAEVEDVFLNGFGIWLENDNKPTNWFVPFVALYGFFLIGKI